MNHDIKGEITIDIEKFENVRWSNRDMWIQRWHHIASEMVLEEPILDMGGGDGTFALQLQKRGFNKITVTDVSPVAVAKARAKGFEAHALNAGQLPLPYEDRAFATVTLIELLEHLYDPLSFLKECARVGKTVVLSVPNFNYFKDRLYMLGGYIPPALNPKNGHIHWFNHTILQRMLDEANLEVESEAFITPKRFLPKFVWRVLGRLMPNLFAAGYVVRCRKKNKEI